MDISKQKVDEKIFGSFLLIPVSLKMVMSFVIAYFLTKNTVAQDLSNNISLKFNPLDIILAFGIVFFASGFFIYLSYPLFATLKEIISEEYLNNLNFVKSVNFCIRSQLFLLLLNIFLVLSGYNTASKSQYFAVLATILISFLFDAFLIENYFLPAAERPKIPENFFTILSVCIFLTSLFFIPTLKYKAIFVVFRSINLLLFKILSSNEFLVGGYLKKRVGFLFQLLLSNIYLLVYVVLLCPQILFNLNISSNPFLIFKMTFEKLFFPQFFKIITSVL